MKTIVIDAGHGGYDYGAVNGNRYEKDDNLRIAKLVAEKLKAAGQNVIMTRNSDIYIPLLERSRISNANNADMLVSFHRNSYTNNTANGVETYVHPAAGQATRSYSKNVQDGMAAVGSMYDRGVKEGNFSVLRNTTAPALLLEIGFISNASDNLAFDNDLNKFANGIADGILKSLGETGGNTTPTPPPSPRPPASSDAVIKAIQETLNRRYSAGLNPDGIYGPKTKTALIKGFQTELNRAYGAGLNPDGIFGAKSKAATPTLKRGMDNNLVYILQAMLYINGYDIAVDGAFGPKTEEAVKSFQRSKGLNPDGLAGPATIAALFA